jgi:nucleotide-binding universal stress UspA family protein
VAEICRPAAVENHAGLFAIRIEADQCATDGLGMVFQAWPPREELAVSYKVVMVHVELGTSNARLLKMAGDLVERFQADVIGVAACRPIQIPFDDVSLTGEVIAEDRAEIEKELKAAEAEFRAAFKERSNVAWRCTVTFGSLADYIAHQARSADLLITGPDIGGGVLDTTRRVGIADLALQAGRPVLVVPHDREELMLQHVLVGWKDTRESRRAIADALPVLQKAAKVTVVQITPDAEMSRAKQHLADVQTWLGRHGVSAAVEAIAAAGEDGTRLRQVAYDKAADLIVAGAYGHSRLHEWVLGGVTGDFLLHPDRCVLVSH